MHALAGAHACRGGRRCRLAHRGQGLDVGKERKEASMGKVGGVKRIREKRYYHWHTPF